MEPEYYTKHSLPRAARLDARCKAIKSLDPVGYLYYTTEGKIALYSVEQLRELTKEVK
jgi:hypothetical protein